MSKSHPLFPELIRYVRQTSPFYRELYRDLPAEVESVEQLPLLNNSVFWEANDYDANRVLTAPISDGLILKSGGTTGKPKFSVFTRNEWAEFTQASANHMAKCGLRDGDRVANVFYAGELYGSFIFVQACLERCPVRTLSLPIAGGTLGPSDILNLCWGYEATVVAGFPTTFMRMIEEIEQKGLSPRSKLRLFLFAGEPMYPDQRARAQKVIPGLEIRSIGYASNDAGLIGYPDATCGPNEFRCYGNETIFEILDEETHLPIDDENREGLGVVTDVKRKLMPIIRYPVGDRVMWLEPQGTPDRKFKLLGRSEEAARVGCLNLYYDDIRSLLTSFQDELPSFQFQLLVHHVNEKDGLTIRIGARGCSDSKSRFSSLGERIIQTVYKNRPAYPELLSEGKINPIQIEWVEMNGLEINPRSGKLRRVIDLRA